jgi:hypothetical protein
MIKSRRLKVLLAGLAAAAIFAAGAFVIGASKGRPSSPPAAPSFTAAEAPGLPGVLKAAVLARGFRPLASGEPKARPLTDFRSSLKEFREMFGLIRATLNRNKVTFAGKTGPVSGFAAGTTYPEIWVRDSATILPASRLIYETPVLKSWLLEHLAYQKADGQLEDWFDGRGKSDKNTTETDQETSAVRAAADITKLVGPGWLAESVLGEPVLSRLERALQYVVDKKFDKARGLVVGAHTADWGDVDMAYPDQRAIYIDKNTHLTCDIYDQAQFYGAATALARLLEETGSTEKAAVWTQRAAAVRDNAETWLWQEDRGYYRVHIHLDSLRHDFDEDAMFAMGGNTEAALTGLASPAHIKRIIQTALDRQKKFGISTISGSLLPPYPKGFFKHPILDDAYEYQNGGQWDWFGGKLVAVMFSNGFSRTAKEKLLEIAKKNIAAGGLYEWDKQDGAGQGSASYSGSAGSLALALFEGYFGLGISRNGLAITPRLGGDQASVQAVIPAAGIYVTYDYKCDKEKGTIVLRLDSNLNAPGSLEVVVPAFRGGPLTSKDKEKIAVLLDGRKAAREVLSLNDDLIVKVATDFRNRTVEVRYFRPIE